MEMPLLKTPSLELASTLYALGHPIKGIYSIGNSLKMQFYFDDNDKIRQAMQDYFDRKLKVEPNELFWSRREIISRMKNDKGS